MKIVVLLLFVVFFVIAPLYTLSALVMPDVQSVKSTYASAEATAQAIEVSANK